VIYANQSGRQRLWYDSIYVKPNTEYEFSFILSNVVNENSRNWFAVFWKVNGEKKCLSWTSSNGSNGSNGGSTWDPVSGKYKTGPDETRIEIAITVDEISRGIFALDNIVFKEISPEKSIDCNE
jgi:hypothetical protein